MNTVAHGVQHGSDATGLRSEQMGVGRLLLVVFPEREACSLDKIHDRNRNMSELFAGLACDCQVFARRWGFF